MLKRLANLLLRLAISLGAQRVRINVVKDSYSEQTAAVVLTKVNFDEDHAKALQIFLKSPAGAAVSNRLRLVAVEVAINGAQDTRNTVHSAGMSAGWNEAVRYFLSLSRVSRVPETQNKNDEQPPQDEAALLERLSP